jgi:hypothetical protein
MSARRVRETQVGPDAPSAPAPRSPAVPSRGPTPKGFERIATPPLSLEEAEAQYLVAREAWTGAMRRASSGRSADLASLAIAQEAFEMASAQRDGWQAAARPASPARERSQPRGVEVIARQDLAWRRIRESPRRRPRLLGRVARFARRIIGRR